MLVIAIALQIVVCILIGFFIAQAYFSHRSNAGIQENKTSASKVSAAQEQERSTHEQESAAHEQQALAPKQETTIQEQEPHAAHEQPSAGAEEEASLNPEKLPLTDDMRTVFDYDAFEQAVLYAPNLVTELRMFVEDIRMREAQEGKDRFGQEVGLPGDVELFAATQIEESGILQPGIASYRIHAIRLTRSRLFYLRIEHRRIPLAVRQAVLRLESALNRIFFTTVYFDDIAQVSLRDAYLLNQRIEQVFPSQISSMLDNMEPAQTGEWDARLMLGAGIESFQLPYRLVCDYRMNLKERIVAISVNLTPPELFGASSYLQDIDKVVPTTKKMRAQAASDYALRLGIMIAGFAFQCSQAINEVYVRGIVDDARHKTCYYSVCFDRTRFSAINLEQLDTLPWHYRCFAARFRMEDGVLQPVEPTFSLDEERFSPKRRFEEVELSHRFISRKAADVLGIQRVSDLAIDENAQRRQVAETISRKLTEYTEDNVHAILAATKSNPHPSVQDAAKRTVQKLIDGSLAEDNVYAIEEEFVLGDELNVELKHSLQNVERHGVKGIIRTLAPLLQSIDARGLYQDTDEVVHRHFNSYAERALYNRNHNEKQTVELAPDAYYNAHLVLSMAYLNMGNTQQALAYAQRASEMNPMDANPRLLLARGFESQNRWVDAIREIQHLLRNAYTPESAGTGYYRMAYMQLHEGRPDLAEACYYKSLQFSSSVWPIARYELEMLHRSNPELDNEAEASSQFETVEELDNVLRLGGIEVVSVEQVCKSAYECGKAAMEADLFPVARSFARMLASLSGDDAVFDLIRSIESDPDR